jgi:hypothetical protein
MNHGFQYECERRGSYMDDIKERVNQVLEYTSDTLNTNFDTQYEAMNLRNSLVVIELKLKILKKLLDK